MLWAASIALNGFAALVLIPKSRHFRLFYLFIAASFARSLWLLSATDSHSRYIWISANTAPYMILLEAFAVLHIFWALTDNYPRWHFAGSVFLSGLILLGAGGAWLLQSVGVPVGWSGTWQAAYLFQRHWMVGCAITLLGMRALLSCICSPQLPVRPIVQRAADCLAVSIALGAITAQLVMLAGTPVPTWARCVGPLAGCINGLLWTLWLPLAAVERGGVVAVSDHTEIRSRNRTGEGLLRALSQTAK